MKLNSVKNKTNKKKEAFTLIEMIGVLAVIMLVSIEPRFQIPEAVTASVGVIFIGAAFTWSVLRNRRNATSQALS